MSVLNGPSRADMEVWCKRLVFDHNTKVEIDGLTLKIILEDAYFSGQENSVSLAGMVA